MAKPAYSALLAHACANGADPAMVFVPTRKHARLTALDLLTYAAADGQPRRFLHCAEEDLAPFVARLREPALKHAVAFGVAFLHEGTHAPLRDTDAIETNQLLNRSKSRPARKSTPSPSGWPSCRATPTNERTTT
eukprot:4475482-Pyramimonas_sp.AAC.2